MTNGPQHQGNWPSQGNPPPAGPPRGARRADPSWPATGSYPPLPQHPGAAPTPGTPASGGYVPAPDDINGPTVQLQINRGRAALPRKRPRWILPAALVAVMAVSAGITYAVAGGSESDAPTDAHAGDTTYRVMPAKMLPNLDQVQQATLLSLKPNGTVSVAVAPDSATTPEGCQLTVGPAGQLAWGSAVSVATEAFTDNTATDFTATTFVGLAVFSAPPAAADTLKKVSDSVRSCTEFTQPGTDANKNTPSNWTVSDVHTSDGAVTWNTTQKAPGSPWVCGKSYRVVGNLAAIGSLCNQNPADTPTRLTDLVIAAATKQ